jgi:hypothetical protein
MNSKQHIQFLRVQLLCTLRLSQRALDYAIKGYQLSSSDFCVQVNAVEHKLGEHHRQIKYLWHKLAAQTVTSSADRRFVLAAVCIDHALQKIYEAATQIAQVTMLRLESSPVSNCDSLDRLGILVNSLMRLCTIALFESEDSYAEIVLQSQETWRQYEQSFDASSDCVDQEGQHGYALAISQSLGLISKQTHQMADAILFWLRDRETVAVLDVGGKCGDVEHQPAAADRLLISDCVIG